MASRHWQSEDSNSDPSGVTVPTNTRTSPQSSTGKLPVPNPKLPHFSLRRPMGPVTSEYHPKKAKRVIFRGVPKEKPVEGSMGISDPKTFWCSQPPHTEPLPQASRPGLGFWHSQNRQRRTHFSKSNVYVPFLG
ncbi:hypothetical protein EVAR_52228_1 [Eumeta japonica]|uniref:Uncharacterized protein n=1 Tax=Eumeta variegata TaxID=151549 RepID=A0A4C1Z4L7_EUMVA|nr:hypothetical protein EVAR_52228_1 [Eumeta japonica]